jgi:hypothetical protein
MQTGPVLSRAFKRLSGAATRLARFLDPCYIYLTMSLATLVNGADCGPLNPIQGLTKNLDSDRGLQQVHALEMYIHRC